MKHHIKVIAFDADDTLWSNEPFFQEVEQKYTKLLNNYGSAQEISEELFKTEMGNLECLGYGVKAFTISMVETALRVSEQRITAEKIQEIILLGKSLLEMPIKLLPDVEETLKRLKALKAQNGYRLVVATKGDLLDQERKLKRSGLTSYFDHIEIMSDKTEKEYNRLLQVLHVAPEEFLMIGNSLKSDIQPVLAIGGYGIHIPFEVMWKHEVVETFTHPRLKQMSSPAELLEWL
ncbi:HAD family hydrolase [uncultured Bacteroides sp.]|uniref:HAD family hydrolase n=1 Tax=uncultured Bacteroides sp. TaxID=162156 RepID=UPI0026166827|nr:HAD family hydrolase [uncultured Bacteroides sp.]